MNTFSRRHKKEGLKGFILAADLVPEQLWKAVFSLPEEVRMKSEEFRLRAGQPLTLTIDGRVHIMRHTAIRSEDIEALLAKATRCSMHSYEKQMQQGFITARNGCRIGLCGIYDEAADGPVLRDIQAVNLRIARQCLGIGEKLHKELFPGGKLRSVLLVSPPGIGKTTLLRDLCRILSAEHRVAVADCRFEIRSEQFDLGACDVMQGGEKSKSIRMLMRAMSPDVIAVDEITDPADIHSIKEAGHTGICFLATAHGGSMEDLLQRPLYQTLLQAEIFEKIVLLERSPLGRTYRIMERRIADDKNNWIDHDRHLLLDDGDLDAERDGETETYTEGAYRGTAVDPN